MKVLIRGAGDLASGIACKLFRCGFELIMTDTAVPTTVRRTVAFSPAVYEGHAQVEEIEGVLCSGLDEARNQIKIDRIAVMVDEAHSVCSLWKPDVVVDAIIAKRNLGTTICDADIVIGVGPGFTAGIDCHCVVETKRGHNLGRCIWEGSAIPDTGVPGVIGGYSKERIIRASADGIFRGNVPIGALVKAGDIVGFVDDMPIYARIDGMVRGLLQDGVAVTAGMKSGDIDPRGADANCRTVSDKAAAIGGGVIEAIMSLVKQRRTIKKMR